MSPAPGEPARLDCLGAAVVAAAPPLVTLHLWGLPATAVPWALTRMAAERFGGTRPDGMRFARWLGTGHGRTFTPRDADLRHWALVTSWDSAGAADAFEAHATFRSWERRAAERWTVRLRPLSSTGRWGGAAPFVREHELARPDAGRPVAVLTRARIARRRLRAFWRSVPPVADRLLVAPGLRFARGIGETPIGLQATFTVWDDLAAAHAFAYRTPEHRAALVRTRAEGWFTEQLFARFEVIDAVGTVDGRDPLAAADPHRTPGDSGSEWGDRRT